MNPIPSACPAPSSPPTAPSADQIDLVALHEKAGREADECVVGALIVNGDGRVFAQKRAATRRMFPGCWDIAGGHVEPGESLHDALAREIKEETGWLLRRIIEPIAIFDWSAEGPNGVRLKREFDFLVEVEGDLDHPRLESDKCSEFRWFGPDDTEALKENRAPGDTIIHDIIVAALRRTSRKPAAS